MLMHDATKKVQGFMSEFNLESIVVTPVVVFLLVWAGLVYDPKAVSSTLMAVIALSPIWLPLFLAVFFWTSWMHYIRYIFWFKQDFVLLHIELPPEVEKSPAAMELFLVSLWNAGGETTFIQRLWKGQFRPTWSLEITSNEGRLSFYLHLRRALKNIIEARLYGQYPEARMTEVEDYTTKIPSDLSGYELWGTEYKKGAAGALPIRTYIDYELDKNADTPETKVDPMTNTLELFSSLGAGEHFWMQIVLKARKRDEWYGFYANKKKDAYVDEAKATIKAITLAAAERTQALLKEDDPSRAQVATRGAQLLTGGEKLRIEAIERSLSKNVFECGFRVIYIAKKDKFDGIKIGTMIRFFDAYRYPDYNSLSVTRGMQIFDYPWQDFNDIRKNYIAKKLLFWYKHRAFFYVPYDQPSEFMTTEELATMWHFPNSSVKTPGLQRVPSRVSEAPSNLPV